MAEEIKISPGDLPEARKEFGLSEEDRDLSKAKALIHVRGKRAEFRGDKDSITVKVPSDADHGPLTIVVTTDAGKTVAILKYRRDENDPKRWKNEKAKDENKIEGGTKELKKK